MATDTVTTNADSGVGSLRAVLAAAAAGDTIVFSPTVFTSTTTDDIKLASSLTITKNVNIEGHIGGGSGTANIKLDGQNLVTDLVINSGVAVYLDGLLIENGKSTGVTGTAAAGGIFDSGTLTLNNSIVSANTATGGAGANGSYTNQAYTQNGTPGQAGKASGGGIYVASGGTLNLVSTTNAFSANTATGGNGGTGGGGYEGGSGGAGGTGAYATSAGTSNRTASSGSSGPTGFYGRSGGAGGAAGQAGTKGQTYSKGYYTYEAPSGGGGGGNAFANSGGLGTIQTVLVPCYGIGTLIRTDRGDVAVENLMIGDRLLTLSGEALPLRWIGRRSYAGWLAIGNSDVQPIRFKAGSLADHVPSRDLLVSPEHAMFLDGVLIPARHLINNVSILKATLMEEVHYFHLELGQHAVIFAEDAAAESFVDDDSREMFHNAHEFHLLYPQQRNWGQAVYCAPRVEDGLELAAVQRALMSRAVRLLPDGSLGPVPILQGYLERVARTSIEGWAYAPETGAITLAILDNGAVIGRVRADCYRGDLEEAGIGDGRHGFHFLIPNGFARDTRHVIEVRRDSDWTLVSSGPVILEPEDDVIFAVQAQGVKAVTSCLMHA